MRSSRIRSKALIQSTAVVFTLAVVLILVTSQSAQAQTFAVLYSFMDGTDGGFPIAGLTLDSAGNLYGTTSGGGSGLFGCEFGCGTVFELDTAGNETVLYNFGENSTDGESPEYGYLFRDGFGNLFGTTVLGGTYGSGTIFKVSPTGNETAVSFPGGTGAGFPFAGLIFDAAGNAYGTTRNSGTGCAPFGCGTVFKVSNTGKVTVLHSFVGVPDGELPIGDLVRDGSGNLYGTTPQGGEIQRGRLHLPGIGGTVFKVSPAGKEIVLYSFCQSGPTCVDGQYPRAGLVLDSAGNLYGTTQDGGANGGGVVFKLDPAGLETVLYSFCSQPGCTDGANPYASLVQDGSGNLYGTTEFGGSAGLGTVFELSTTGVETVLYSFCTQDGCADGDDPVAGLALDGAGNLYGTAQNGGNYGAGTVFKVTPGEPRKTP